MTPKQARDLTDRLRLYAQPQRLVILSTLLDGALTVGEIETRTDIHQPALSQQLGALRRAEILSVSRDARAVFYDFSDAHQRQRATALLTLFQTIPDPGRRTPPTGDRPAAGIAGNGAAFARIASPRRRPV